MSWWRELTRRVVTGEEEALFGAKKSRKGACVLVIEVLSLSHLPLLPSKINK